MDREKNLATLHSREVDPWRSTYKYTVCAYVQQTMEGCGAKIGRIFAYWMFVFFGQFFENWIEIKNSLKFSATFSVEKVISLIWAKIGWATVWPFFTYSHDAFVEKIAQNVDRPIVVKINRYTTFTVERVAQIFGLHL
jgi:hypothetical protein